MSNLSERVSQAPVLETEGGSAITSLIAQLEAAEAPSRELDLAFHKALGKCPEDARYGRQGEYLGHHDGIHDWRSFRGNIVAGSAANNTFWHAPEPPPYFTSGGIPAELLAEVPDGADWGASSTDGRGEGFVGRRETIDGEEGWVYEHSKAATPALALGTAILRAREAEK